MNEELIWKERAKYLWEAELIFDELKNSKKLNRKQKKEVEKKMRRMTYWVWVNSPKIKNNIPMRNSVIQECLTDWKSLNCVRKGICGIKRSDSAEPVV
jgi:hypothetical protein